MSSSILTTIPALAILGRDDGCSSKSRGRLLGREPASGALTVGGSGDMPVGVRLVNSLKSYGAAATPTGPMPSPSSTQRFWSVCDWRLMKL